MDEDKELRDVLSKLDEEEKKLQVIRKLQSQLEELEKEQKTLIDRVVEQHLSFKERVPLRFATVYHWTAMALK